MSIFPMYPRKFDYQYGKPITISRRRPADMRFSENYSFPVQNYADYCGDMVIRAYRDLVINEGVTITTAYPCKGLYIYCDGDCVINGTLSMTARGAKFNPNGEGVPCRPKGEAFLNVTFTYPYTAEQLEDYIRRYIDSIAENGMPQAAWPSYIINNIYTIPEGDADLATIPAVGADGGAPYSTSSQLLTSGRNGSNGSNRQSGGGGGGALYFYTPGSITASGGGAKGTAYGGGSGGGGMTAQNQGTRSGNSGVEYCGAGGAGVDYSAMGKSGGGAGNPGGSPGTGTEYNGESGQTGVGGLIILIVRGNLTIGANGKIESKGMNGGKGSRAGGGGSGGGSINIFYGGTYTKTGQVLATGGSGGGANSGGCVGGNGGDGCITEQKIGS